ncbi:MAG: CAP domain-containing protein [Chitinophagales bacterium]
MKFTLTLFTFFFLSIGILLGNISCGINKKPTSSKAVIGNAKPHQTISPNKFDQALLEELIHEKVNEIRAKKRKSTLDTDVILRKAATEQSRYVKVKRKLTHNQTNAEKRTVMDRVLYYKGSKFKSVGENLAYVGFTVEIQGKKRKILYPTYEEMAEEIVWGWVKSKPHYKNMLRANYNHVGTSALYDVRKGGVYATQVFGQK